MKLCEIALTSPFAAILVSFGLILGGSATDRYVSAELDYGWGKDGKPVEGDKIYDKLQAAIKASSNGDTIWIKDGFVSTEQYGTKKGTCYTGIFLDKAVTLRSVSGDARTGNPPILKGAPAKTPGFSRHPVGDVLGNDATRAIYVTAPATIKGLVFSDGSCSHSQNGVAYPNGHGGGGVMTTTNAVFEKCVIRNNYGGYGGGIMAKVHAGCEGEVPTFSECVVSNNWGWFMGGASAGQVKFYNCDIVCNNITNDSSNGYSAGVDGNSWTYSPSLYNCTVTGNVNWCTATGGGMRYAYATNCLIANNTTYGGSGGGASFSHLTDCRILDNSVKDRAGGVKRTGGGVYSCVCTNCFIAGNEVSGHGGGVCNGTTVGCIISNNTALSNGGGMYFSEAGFVNIGNRIVCNEAVNAGGGFHDGAGEGMSYNCLIAWNAMTSSSQTTGGGGVSSSYSPSRYTHIVNCTVVSNRSVKGTGGVYHCDLINSISWGNVKGEKTVSDYSGIRVATNSCCSGFSYPTAAKAAGCTTADPKFRRGCVYQIGPRSPCRETGTILTDDAVFFLMQKDIDGNPRFGEKDGEPTIDMGCCQYAPFGLMLMMR